MAPTQPSAVFEGKRQYIGGWRKIQCSSDDIVKGNVLELVIKSWAHLRSMLAYKTVFGANGQFEQKYIYMRLRRCIELGVLR